MTQRQILIFILALFVGILFWIFHTSENSTRPPHKAPQEQAIPSLSSETIPPDTVRSEQEMKTPTTSSTKEIRKELSAEELERLKLTDYHAYVRYKAKKQQDSNDDSLSSDPANRKEDQREVVRQKLLEHLRTMDAKETDQ